MHIVIVGAGIVGLSTAYQLARRGHAVTLIERGPVPNPLAASTDHHRLIRYSYADQPVYCARIREAFEHWRAMWAEFDRPEDHYYAATGILTLSQTAGDWGDRARATLDDVGIAYRKYASVHELETAFPFLETANGAYGFLSEGGALMANRIMADLADLLRSRGVKILEHSPVRSVDSRSGSATLEDGRLIAGDCLVVTAGVNTAGLAAGMALDLTPYRTVIVYADPPADLAEAYAGAPCWTDLGGDDDLWGVAPVHGLPLKLGCGRLGRTDDADGDRTMRRDEVEAMISAYRGRFRGIDDFEIRFCQANYWTRSPDERFVLERADRLVAVSACSGHGFKFGALSGSDVADAVEGSVPVDRVKGRLAGLAA